MNNHRYSFVSTLRPFFVLLGVVLSIHLLNVRMSAQTADPVIQLLSPSGGESYLPGDTVEIRFEIKDQIIFESFPLDTFAIEFSTDRGVSWTEEFVSGQDFTGDSKSLKWIVPDVSSSECLIRIVQRTGRWGRGRVVRQRDIPVIAADSLFESVFRPSDSLLVINAMDRLHIVDPWNPGTPVRTIVWHYPMDYGRLINVRFEQSDSLITVGSVPVCKIGNNYSRTGEYGIIDFHTGEPIKMFQARFRASSGPMQLTTTRGGFCIDITQDGTRMLRSHTDNTDIISVESEAPLFENRTHSQPWLRGGSISQFSPDERYFVVGGQESISVWDAETLDTVWAHIRSDADQAQYSHDGRFILVTPGFREEAYQEWDPPQDYTGQSNRILDALSGDTILTRRITKWRPNWDWYREEVHGAFAARSNAYTFQDRVYSDFELPNPRYFQVPTHMSAAVAPDGTQYCLVNDLGVLTVHDMGILSQPGDTCNVPFAIASEAPLAGDVVFEPVVVGESSDTVAQGFLINPGSGTLSISEIVIVEGHDQDFAITSGKAPFSLAPGARADLGVRFSPTDSGSRSVTVAISTSSGTVQAEIRGVGLHPDPKVGVGEVERSEVALSVTASPNPVHDLLTISVVTPRGSQVLVDLVDVAGRAVHTMSLRLSPGENLFWMDVSDVPAGAYRILVSGTPHRIASDRMVIVQ